VGGQEATQAISYQITVSPAQVSLCGGTMLDAWTVLSAAHCFPLTVQEGDTLPTAANTIITAGALTLKNDDGKGQVRLWLRSCAYIQFGF
jgi:secreted trypsin-like serine protease